ncbi:MAG: FKBP-type peptidyl-prolyl cis-trans isomerase, partial [Phycisphaerales bacterium JB064]
QAETGEGEGQATPDVQTESQPETEPQGEQPTAQPASTQGFAELGITDEVVGEGEEVKPRATVTIHYRGTFRESGEEFDSSYSRGQPAEFPLDGVIEGFSKGLLGMKVGGKRRVEIPWSMAYGERGRPPAIPPKSDLVFDIELISVQNAQPPQKPELASSFEGEPQDLGEGLIVRDIVVGGGQGEVKPGATAIVHYRGVLAESGEQFDSSYARGEPAKFKLDPGALIEGFSRGLMGMKAGGKRRIEIPSELGYGQYGSPPKIPANADLVFEVEILTFTNPRELSVAWVSEEKRDNGLICRTVKEGAADAEPMPEDAIAVLHTIGVLEDGTKFDSTFDLGEPVTVPLESAIIDGWRQGVVGMKPGEVRQIVVPPELAFGEEGQAPVIPPDATLTFEVELIEWREPRLMSIEFVAEEKLLEEGITIRDVKIGEGPEAAKGQTAFIHYIAQVPDGTVVVNTFDSGNLNPIPLTDDPLLPGLRKAIIGMKQGGVRRVELAPDQAFGEEGNPPLVPGNTPMVFEVELVAVQ